MLRYVAVVGIANAETERCCGIIRTAKVYPQRKCQGWRVDFSLAGCMWRDLRDNLECLYVKFVRGTGQEGYPAKPGCEPYRR